MVRICQYSLAIIVFFTGVAFAISESELIIIKDGFEARREKMLNSQIESQVPAYEVNIAYNRLVFALAALYQNERIQEANDAVIEACNVMLKDPDCPTECGFHWRGGLVIRIYELFNSESKHFPGRLSEEAEKKLAQTLWFWLNSNSKISDADTEKSRTWWIWESENHHAMKFTTNWGAAQILKDIKPYSGYKCEDGNMVNQHYKAWTKYAKEYLRERAMRGGLIEVASHTYGTYTLQGWYNFYDLAEDPILQKYAEYMLDIWWTEAAMEQFEGLRGGGKARVYPDRLNPNNDYLMRKIWFYLGVGSMSKHPSVMCLATSNYRLPLVTMDIAMDYAGRGSFEYISRKPGRNIQPNRKYDGKWIYKVNPDYGGILRYSYITPDFVMGTSMVENIEHSKWAYISDQNRIASIVFRDGSDKFIVPMCSGGPAYNQYWSVQNKGTMIVQKLNTSVTSGDMRVLFGSALEYIEEEGWIFVNTENAYAAVRPAWGGYVWDEDNWMRCNEEYSPVIIEVVRAYDYRGEFNRFKFDVKNQVINFDKDSGILKYDGLQDSGSFTVYTNYESLPLVNGKPIDLAPDFTYKSPFLNSKWGSGVVTISKDGREKILDFNKKGYVSKLQDIENDEVAQRSFAMLNQFYEGYRNMKGMGEDPFTVRWSYSAIALGKDLENANLFLSNLLDNRSSDGLYWELITLSKMISDNSLSERLSDKNKRLIKDVLWDFASKSDCKDWTDRSSIDQLLRVFGSDNHDMIKRGVLFITSQVLKDDSRYNSLLYNDGSTAAQRYEQWVGFMVEFISKRAMLGCQIEFASPVYTGVFLQPIFLLRDCAQDNRVRSQADKFLTLYFADVAQESLRGVRGGSKVRTYKVQPFTKRGLADTVVYYNHIFFGKPDEIELFPNNASSAKDCLVALSTSWRPNDILENLAKNTEKCGSFEYISSRLAKGVNDYYGPCATHKSTFYSPSVNLSFRRYTYTTPSYVLGTFTVDENSQYIWINSQNQWMGAITDSDVDSRVAVVLSGAINCSGITGRTGFRELQAVQNKHAAIIRKQISSSHKQLIGVYYSNDFEVQFIDDWMFGVNGSKTAYFAFTGRQPYGDSEYLIEEDNVGKWVRFTNPDTMIIIELSQVSEYDSLSDFTDDVLDNAIKWELYNEMLSYQSTRDAGELKMFYDTRIPKVNGQPVEINLQKTYDSPYLEGYCNDKVIKITDYMNNSMLLEFE